MKLILQKLEGYGLLGGENCIIQLQTLLTDPPVWQTDRRNCHGVYAL